MSRRWRKLGPVRQRHWILAVQGVGLGLGLIVTAFLVYLSMQTHNG